MEGSLFAQVMLGLSFPVIIASFFVFRPHVALVIAALGGEMFLPEGNGFKFPFLPPFDKHNLPYVAALIGCFLKSPKMFLRLPTERWFQVMVLLVVGGGVVSGLTNPDAVPMLRAPPLPAMTLKDGFFLSFYNATRLCFPFLLGLAIYRKPADLRALLIAFSVAAMIYLPFILWEIRMSPNLHRLIYGYFQGDDFTQTRRWGGYRPVVFMSHGLAVARFMVCATMAPFIFGNTARGFLGVPWKVNKWILCVVVILCKSTGAIVYLIAMLPLLIRRRAKRMIQVSVILAAIVFLYPVLRFTGVFPVQGILDASTSLFNADRSGSMAFRFKNEDLMLARARERPLFGWGSYGRNFTYDENGNMSIPDGYWILILGMLGVAGYTAGFALLLVPIVIARRRLKSIPDEQDRRLVAGAALILAILSVDLIPNGLWGLYEYMLAGALTGTLRGLRQEALKQQAALAAAAQTWDPSWKGA
jgi:hypothetical protein